MFYKNASFVSKIVKIEKGRILAGIVLPIAKYRKPRNLNENTIKKGDFKRLPLKLHNSGSDLEIQGRIGLKLRF